jgi:Fic family protein
LRQDNIPNDTDGIYQYAISLFLQMARIQFFYDGNKRTGRLMMNGVLLTNGLFFSNASLFNSETFASNTNKLTVLTKG